ncbi:DUF58 domain-containing protein [Nocardioides sp. zg-536]|uniref:DUF58 domain-containing protein n=1 Tax=Nocardioides faecalis TaxID=2803858 RepID=A0A939BVC3_9ACTN|nr:DUF58 domain-containing protein [Nocardioides faecalis]MBM9459417.1 DUF58 domain-containing protein [Nocardioides faecalis]QVI59476.1 DUF58 domain-containing protein [Nocardioides faecalis]
MTAHLTRVRTRLSIHAHRRVRGLLEGDYAAIHTGRGIDFNDLREYVRGDDVKDIDWKASARTRTPLIKRYVAERKHTVLLCVSTGRSMAALNRLQPGAAETSKRDLAVFVAGVMGYLAVQHGDLVGLVHGDAAGQHGRRAEGGELHLERLLGAVHDATTPEGAHSDLAALLRYVVRTVRRRTILVVICDDTTITEPAAEMLRRLTAQHEVLFLTIGDLDPTGAAVGGRRLVDVDTSAQVPGWLRRDRRLHEEYAALLATEEQQLRRRLEHLGVVHERVHDTDSAIGAVHRLLERHRHARRR